VTDSLCVCSTAVAQARADGRPVVALETTLVTHGLPSPEGLETALALEDDVRRCGATPATIGVLRGAIHVGLTPDQIKELAAAPGVMKTNLSNLGAVVASGGHGSTTVAATMFAAHAVGIRVLATGGIGGVHRDVELSGDVSADLTALGRIPVAVVCAGAKAILDLPRTLEMLETLGVPVLGLCTDTFPAFYRRSSGLPADRRFETVDEMARALRAHFQLNLSTGVVVGNPIPQDAEMPEAVYEVSLATALREARDQAVRGRSVTPFLLERLRTLTGGASLRANVALLRHNARVAAQLAVAMAQQAR
jgi:pseudouridine-5'-phosphate glycosidase